MIDRDGLQASEQVALDWLIAREFEVFRNGWPDFLCVHPDSGEVHALEVKTGQRPTENQAQVHFALWEAGLPVFLMHVYDGQVVWRGPSFGGSFG